MGINLDWCQDNQVAENYSFHDKNYCNIFRSFLFFIHATTSQYTSLMVNKCEYRADSKSKWLQFSNLVQLTHRNITITASPSYTSRFAFQRIESTRNLALVSTITTGNTSNVWRLIVLINWSIKSKHELDFIALVWSCHKSFNYRVKKSRMSTGKVEVP